ncbi:MAG: glutathione S-transferase family protein [Pseudomonadota bacterium]
MIELYHYAFDAASRTIRLALGEYGVQVHFTEERVWERRREFLVLNPACTLPVLVSGDGVPVCGAFAIGEFLAETCPPNGHGWTLLPEAADQRAEARRLVDWFDRKFEDEVTRNVVHEKIVKRFMPRDVGGGAPDMNVIHVGLSNLRTHLKYIEHLLARRKWLAGDALTWADFAAAAQLSCVDYLGHITWDDAPGAKDWYARVKSRPSFRPLLSDTVPGMPAAQHYVDLDF